MRYSDNNFWKKHKTKSAPWLRTTMLPRIQTTKKYYVSSAKIDINTVFFLQYEGRGSLIGTGSLAVGIAIDTQFNIGVYTTGSLGLGLTLGASTGWTVGFATADSLHEIKGLGINGGLYVTAGAGGGLQGAWEINIPVDIFAEDDSFEDIYNAFDVGVSLGVPIQAGVIGCGYGVYTDLSWTHFLVEGNLAEMVTVLVNKIKTIFGVNVTQEQKIGIEDSLFNFKTQVKKLNRK